MRVHGRLKYAKILYSSKHQKILPKENHISELIVRKLHNHGHK